MIRHQGPATGRFEFEQTGLKGEEAVTMARAIFPDPDHDHEKCSVSGMTQAEEVCRVRGQRLTPLRRQVLEVLLASHKPMGAYEIIEEAGVVGSRPAPITVYRALEFLIENGLAHRIESRNAYIACVHTHAADAMVVFLICEKCGAVGEAPSADAAAALALAARAAGFAPKTPVIEVTGICAHCRG
jgi:Fur family zinc uptake transcriptional regulator